MSREPLFMGHALVANKLHVHFVIMNYSYFLKNTVVLSEPNLVPNLVFLKYFKEY